MYISCFAFFFVLVFPLDSDLVLLCPGVANVVLMGERPNFSVANPRWVDQSHEMEVLKALEHSHVANLLVDRSSIGDKVNDFDMQPYYCSSTDRE